MNYRPSAIAGTSGRHRDTSKSVDFVIPGFMPMTASPASLDNGDAPHGIYSRPLPQDRRRADEALEPVYNSEHISSTTRQGSENNIYTSTIGEAVLQPDENIFVTPITPFMLMERVRKLPQWRGNKITEGYKLLPHTRTLEPLQLPYGWKQWIHPDRKRLFENIDKKVLTYTDISDLDNCRAIDRSYDILMTSKKYKTALNRFLVLDLRDAGNMLEVGYYIVEFDNQMIVWGDPVDVEKITLGDRDVQCTQHLGLAMRYQYWKHQTAFPIYNVFKDIGYNSLHGELLYGLNDMAASGTSVVEYTNEHIQELNEIMGKFEKGIPSKEWHLMAARKLSALYWQAFITFRNQPEPRSYDPDTENTRKWWFLMLSPFLFWMPQIYLNDLQEIWRDDEMGPTVNVKLWNEFITTLRKDWENSTTPATVLLSANVGLLAIQSIDDTKSNKSAAQITSYISTSLSLATYIAFQILARRHRPLSGRLGYHHSAQVDTINYLCRHMSTFGYEFLALAFSVPIGCFIWSMLTFLLSVSFVFFFDTSVVTRIVMGVVYGLLIVVSGILLYMSWGSSRQVDPFRVKEYRNTGDLAGIHTPGEAPDDRRERSWPNFKTRLRPRRMTNPYTPKTRPLRNAPLLGNYREPV